MKYVAVLMVVLLLASVVGVGYLYMTANVTVDGIGVIAVEASTQPDLFASLQEQVAEGRVIGTAYTAAPIGSAENYQFYTYTVRLKNNSFLTADMVEVQVTPMDGDVLQIGDETARALPARSTGDISATILTNIGMHAIRELNVTYYMWGIPFSTRTAYGQ